MTPQTAPKNPLGSCLKNIGLISVLFFAMIVPPSLGCVSGLRIADFVNRSVSQPWEVVGALPEPAVKFVSPEGAAVFVEAVSGKTYSCCWTPVSDAQQPADPNRCKGTPGYYQTPAPPGRVIDQRDASFCRAEAVILATYVILEDGSVWKLQYMPNPLGAFTGVAVWGLSGAGVGIVVSVILVSLIMRLKK